MPHKITVKNKHERVDVAKLQHFHFIEEIWNFNIPLKQKKTLFPFPSKTLEKIQVCKVASPRPLKRPSKVT
jgi:hypothetical protein